MFDREFIKTGIFDKSISKSLDRAFELRQKGDYMEQSEITQKNVDEMLPEAITFVNKIKRHIL